eukprot:SAG22_NODE_3450_length_1705_cov_1.362391_2_plen_224_part_00
MATPDHTPHGRGHRSSLHYFHHDNDYWSQHYQLRCNGTSMTDLWRKGPDAEAPEMPARGYNSSCSGYNSMQPAGAVDPEVCQPGPYGDKDYGGYEDALFAEAVLKTVGEHGADGPPVYLFWAPHIVHAPLQCPQSYLDEFAFIAPTDQAGGQRQKYHAMVKFADDAVGNLTALIKGKGMWENSVRQRSIELGVRTAVKMDLEWTRKASENWFTAFLAFLCLSL